MCTAWVGLSRLCEYRWSDTHPCCPFFSVSSFPIQVLPDGIHHNQCLPSQEKLNWDQGLGPKKPGYLKWEAKPAGPVAGRGSSPTHPSRRNPQVQLKSSGQCQAPSLSLRAKSYERPWVDRVQGQDGSAVTCSADPDEPS